MRTSKQYIESLRDGREVYFKGQRVQDVTVHAGSRLAIDHAAIDSDIAESKEHRALAVYEENGKKFSRYFKLPCTSEDLLLRSLHQGRYSSREVGTSACTMACRVGYQGGTP